MPSENAADRIPGEQAAASDPAANVFVEDDRLSVGSQKACPLANSSVDRFVFPLLTVHSREKSRTGIRLALQYPGQIYSILFRAVSETLLTIAADSNRPGSPDGSRWIACQKSFFVYVGVLSALFRRKFLTYLREAFRQGKLSFHGELTPLAQPDGFEALCHKASKINWVVHAKAPFGGPEQVLKYLARYTHRVAISNSRLLSLENGQVTFQ